MLYRTVNEDEKAAFNAAVGHPLQSWEWGEFRKRTGVEVERIGYFDKGKLINGLQLTFHKIPVFGQTLGYFPRGPMPDEDQLAILRQLAPKHNAMFIKMEPNVARAITSLPAENTITKFLQSENALPGRPLFTKYSFQLDLTQDEEKIKNNLHNKTRYNIGVAQRKGVQIFENTTKQGMENHIEILTETTKRQGFYAHTPTYFRTMWEVMGNSGMMRIFEAHYQGTILVSWIVFVFNGVLYYPYGASRATHREVMASNLMMWEVIRFGKAMGCRLFDMWGALGPEPDKNHAWYGFHKFKAGYGATHVEFIGTYDLILDSSKYQLYKIGETFRWLWLRFMARFRG